jgi:rubrerythrin
VEKKGVDMPKELKSKNTKSTQTSMITCQRCENAYIIIWLSRGGPFNDFGDRHCPFCGLTSEEFYLPVNS